MTKDPLERLNELKAEFRKGEALLVEEQKKTAALQQMLIRISGAIQILEELFSEPESKP